MKDGASRQSAARRLQLEPPGVDPVSPLSFVILSATLSTRGRGVTARVRAMWLDGDEVGGGMIGTAKGHIHARPSQVFSHFANTRNRHYRSE